MESEHFVGKVALRGVIEKDDAILVCKAPRDTVWQFPGGRLHKGENPQMALAREVQEELGAGLVVGEVFYTEQFIHVKSGTPQVFLFFRCSITGDPVLAQKEEVDEFCWVTREELKDLPMWEDCRRAADTYLSS